MKNSNIYKLAYKILHSNDDRVITRNYTKQYNNNNVYIIDIINSILSYNDHTYKKNIKKKSVVRRGDKKKTTDNKKYMKSKKYNGGIYNYISDSRCIGINLIDIKYHSVKTHTFNKKLSRYIKQMQGRHPYRFNNLGSCMIEYTNNGHYDDNIPSYIDDIDSSRIEYIKDNHINTHSTVDSSKKKNNKYSSNIDTEYKITKYSINKHIDTPDKKDINILFDHSTSTNHTKDTSDNHTVDDIMNNIPPIIRYDDLIKSISSLPLPIHYNSLLSKFVHLDHILNFYGMNNKISYLHDIQKSFITTYNEYIYYNI